MADMLCKQGKDNQVKHGPPISGEFDTRRQRKRISVPHLELTKDGITHWTYYARRKKIALLRQEYKNKWEGDLLIF